MEPGITNEEEKKNVTARSTMVQSGRSVQAQQFNMQHLVASLITALDPSPSTHPPLRMQHKAAHQHHRLNPHRADTPEKRWAAQRTKSRQNNPPSPTGPLQLVLKSPLVSYAPPPPGQGQGGGTWPEETKPKGLLSRPSPRGTELLHQRLFRRTKRTERKRGEGHAHGPSSHNTPDEREERRSGGVRTGGWGRWGEQKKEKRGKG